jgi:single-strand DNA-binding protein
VNFSLAENTRRLVDGEWVDGPTTYREVVCFGRQAEHIVASLPRGARAIVVGAFRTRTWRGGDGGERSRLEIVADEVGPSLRWATA